MANHQLHLIGCIFLLFLFAETVKSNYCGPWVAIDIDTIQKPDPNDKIEVHYVVAPLLYCSLGNALSYIGGYHAGIAFTNVRTKYSITLNYDAHPELVDAVLPKIDTKNKTLEWANYGKVFIYEGINTTYWHSQNDVVGSMTGSQFTNFMNGFIRKSNDTYPFYNLWRVYDSNTGDLIQDNFECFNYVWECFKALQSYGGEIVPNLHLKQSFGAIYSKLPPQLVPKGDTKLQDQMIDFYELLEGKLKDLGILGLILELGEIFFEGHFFIRVNEDDYQLKLGEPFFKLRWKEEPVPTLRNNMY